MYHHEYSYHVKPHKDIIYLFIMGRL